MFLTHLILLPCTCEGLAVWILCPVLMFTVFLWLPCWTFEQPLSAFLFLWHNLSNLFFCLAKVLWCLDSLLIFIKFLHSSISSLTSLSSSWKIHVSLCSLSLLRVLFMDLILSFKRALSAFLIIYFPLGVLMVLLSLILTGIRSWLRHLKENLQWFEKCAILFSIFSHHLNVSTFSLPYSLLICKCRLLILFW